MYPDRKDEEIMVFQSRRKTVCYRQPRIPINNIQQHILCLLLVSISQEINEIFRTRPRGDKGHRSTLFHLILTILWVIILQMTQQRLNDFLKPYSWKLAEPGTIRITSTDTTLLSIHGVYIERFMGKGQVREILTYVYTCIGIYVYINMLVYLFSWCKSNCSFVLLKFAV